MRSTFHNLETAKRSLFTHQAALSTTGHNIANANTAGYSRQVVNMAAARPIEAVGMARSQAPGQLGTGVEFSSITRIREQFLDQQFRHESQSLGSWEVQKSTLDKLEAIINEPSESGMRSVIDKFWTAWSDLSKDSENITSKKIVRESAIALTDAFNHMSKQLTDLQNDLTENIQVKSAQINSALTAIANLNREIQRIEGFGNHANDLRDQRDLITDELSKIININVTELPNGYTITMGGVELVTGNQANAVSPDMLEDAFANGDLNSGEVFGMIVSRDRHVADYLQQLDSLANSIANGPVQITIPKGSVLPEGTVLDGVTYSDALGNRTLTDDLTVTVNGLNGLHQLGYTFAEPVAAGGLFFTAAPGSTGITAASIQLNPDIVADPGRIATSMRTDSGSGNETVIKGNNTLALLISGLRESKITFNSAGGATSEGTVDDYFRSVVGQLGVQSKEATRQLINQAVIVDQVESRRMSVSAVSMDEEMTNMIMFQHAYNAAARVMTVTDEMLDKIINGMGIVGR